MDHCLQWKKEIDDAVQLSNGDPIPIVLIANKVLYVGGIYAVYIYTQVDCPCDDPCDGEEFSKEHGFVDYFKTSAKTGVGIKEAVHCMVKMVSMYLLRFINMPYSIIIGGGEFGKSIYVWQNFTFQRYVYHP